MPHPIIAERLPRRACVSPQTRQRRHAVARNRRIQKTVKLAVRVLLRIHRQPFIQPGVNAAIGAARRVRHQQMRELVRRRGQRIVPAEQITGTVHQQAAFIGKSLPQCPQLPRRHLGRRPQRCPHIIVIRIHHNVHRLGQLHPQDGLHQLIGIRRHLQNRLGAPFRLPVVPVVIHIDQPVRHRLPLQPPVEIHRNLRFRLHPAPVLRADVKIVGQPRPRGDILVGRLALEQRFPRNRLPRLKLHYAIGAPAALPQLADINPDLLNRAAAAFRVNIKPQPIGKSVLHPLPANANVTAIGLPLRRRHRPAAPRAARHQPQPNNQGCADDGGHYAGPQTAPPPSVADLQPELQ